MMKKAFHATNNIEEILATGEIRPTRMSNVFLVGNEVSANLYAKRFGCNDVLSVAYDTKDVERIWRPAYIDHGKVIKLKPGKIAKVTEVES